MQYVSDENNVIHKLSDIEILHDGTRTLASAVVEGWVTRNKDQALLVWEAPPKRDSAYGEWRDGNGLMILPTKLFSFLTWQNEPCKARVDVTLIEDENWADGKNKNANLKKGKEYHMRKNERMTGSWWERICQFLSGSAVKRKSKHEKNSML